VPSIYLFRKGAKLARPQGWRQLEKVDVQQRFKLDPKCIYSPWIGWATFRRECCNNAFEVGGGVMLHFYLGRSFR
jgi:hypothetical protein